MSGQKPDREAEARAKAGRRLALLIAGAGLLAILAPWLVVKLELAARYEILFYLIAMAGFLYAIIQLAALWRRR